MAESSSFGSDGGRLASSSSMPRALTARARALAFEGTHGRKQLASGIVTSRSLRLGCAPAGYTDRNSSTNRQLDQELDREPFYVSVDDLADCRLRYLELLSGLRLTPTPVF